MKAFENATYDEEVESDPGTSASINRNLNRGGGARCSRITCDECSEILHGLNNVFASMLLNAQVMEWKLPSYSRSKRYLHEIERNAQRGGELVKRLLVRVQADCQGDLTDPGENPTLPGTKIAVATQEPTVAVTAIELPLEPAAHTAPVFLSSRRKVPHTIV